MKATAMRLAAAAILTLVLGTNAHANLLVNGSFEFPDVPTGSFGVFPSIPGWLGIEGPGIEIQDHASGTPFDGDQFVELDSFASSSMLQAFTTTPGDYYRFELAYSPRPGVGAGDNAIFVYWLSFTTGLHLLDVLDGVGGNDTNWSLHSYLIQADSGLSGVFLQDGGILFPAASNSLGGYLDATSVEALPEPGTITLVGAGLALLAIGARRRAR
jgi:hypothetical protein